MDVVMMKDMCFLVGLGIYLTVSLIDRFLIKLNDLTYIGLCLIAIIFVIIGLLNKRKNDDGI